MQSVMHYGSNYFLTDAAQAAGLWTMTGWFLFFLRLSFNPSVPKVSFLTPYVWLNLNKNLTRNSLVYRDHSWGRCPFDGCRQTSQKVQNFFIFFVLKNIKKVEKRPKMKLGTNGLSDL